MTLQRHRSLGIQFLSAVALRFVLYEPSHVNAQSAPQLHCAVGTGSCGNWLELGGYETSSGAKCGGDPQLISEPPIGGGVAGMKDWCGLKAIEFVIGGRWKLFKPVWRWQSDGTTSGASGERKACAGASQTPYECPKKRFKATEDTCDCLSSNAFSCIEWNAGFPGQNWPAECFPVVDMEEDKWMPIRVNFWQENLVPSLEPYAYEGPEDITVRIKVWWGILDISGQPDVDEEGNVFVENEESPMVGRTAVEGTVANANSGSCRKTAMTDLGASLPSEDQQRVVCDDDDQAGPKCADVLPPLTCLGAGSPHHDDDDDDDVY